MERLSPTRPGRRVTRAHVLRGALGIGVLGAFGGPLAACGDDDPSGGPGGSSGGGAITFFGWDLADVTTGLGLGFQTAKGGWEAANPGSTVTFDSAPFDQYVSAATTRARARSLGDVVEMLPDTTHQPVFAALQPLKKSDFPDVADELSGWFAGQFSADDPESFAGVPIGAQGVVWYYNRDLFTEAGLDPDTPPVTWDDFTAACEALKGAGVTPLGMSGVDSYLAWWAWSSISPQFFRSTDDLLAVRDGTIPLTDERFRSSLEPLAQTYANGWWNEDYSSKKFTDIEAAFAAGEIAIVPGLISSAINWKVWDERLGPDKYGVFAAPLVPGATEQGQFFNPTLILGIGKDSQQAETARSWISYLTSAAGQETMLAEGGQFPNHRAVDVAALTGSAGATAITQIVAEVGGYDVAQNQFNAAATSAAQANLTVTLVDGDLAGFLAELQRQQES
jgi:ABC-type glycerol-3-phosphate transport system substrate-binding protein